jgi:hypothetical protein
VLLFELRVGRRKTTNKPGRIVGSKVIAVRYGFHLTDVTLHSRAAVSPGYRMVALFARRPTSAARRSFDPGGARSYTIFAPGGLQSVEEIIWLVSQRGEEPPSRRGCSESGPILTRPMVAAVLAQCRGSPGWAFRCSA